MPDPTFEAVARLRDLYSTVEGPDQVQTALLLGLAIADLVATLPDGDPRLPELIEEGQLRLTEAKAGAEDARSMGAAERAERLLAGRTPIPFRPEAASLLGDLHRIPDIGQLRDATETMRLFMQGLPEGHPHRVMMEAVAPMMSVVDGFRSGRWTPEHDHALAGLRRIEAEVRAAGGSLDQDLSLLVRFASAGAQGSRYLSIVNEADADQDLEPAALDDVIAELETVVASMRDAAFPLSELVGGARVHIGCLLVARVCLDARGGGSRNASWFDGTIRLLDRAREHFEQAPPELADEAEQYLKSTATLKDALERKRGDEASAASAAQEHDDKPPPPRPTVPDEPTARRSVPRSPPAGPDQPSALDLQQFRRSWAGLRLVLPALPEDTPELATLQLLMGLMNATEAMASGGWTPEQDRALADLRRSAEQLVAADGDHCDVPWLRAISVMAGVIRCDARGRSLNSQDWPDAAELNGVIAELEDALTELPATDPSARIVAASLRKAGTGLLLRLAGHRGQDTAQLLARARAHLAQVPPVMGADTSHEVAEIERHERLLRGDADLAYDVGTFSGDHGGSFDAGAGDIPRLLAAAGLVRRTQDPAELTGPINALRTARRGLPAGHPEHFVLLTCLADLLGRHATLTRAPEGLADALEAAIEAVRPRPKVPPRAQ